MAEETKIFNIKINYEDYDRYRDAMEQALGTYDENIAQLTRLNAAITANNKAVASLNKADADYAQQLQDLTAKGREYATQKQQLQQILKNEEKLNQATIGSYQELDAMVGRMSMAWRRMNEQQREANAELPATINAMRDQLKAADASIGNFQRNVGNYASGWNGLNTQLQMVVRELPSLTMGANQFFLAISNNLPMLADEIQRAAKANKELKAEGKATTPVFTQLIKSLFSWQTALVVGITLLSTYGKEIAEWARQLMNGKNAVDYLNQSLGQMTGSVMAERAQLEAMFSALRNAKEGTAEYALARQNIIDKYGSLLNNQAKEIKNLQDIDGAYKVLMNTMSAKAIMDASMKQMTEAAEKFGKKINDITGDIRGVFDDYLPEKGYTKEQINNLFAEYIAGIASNEPKLKARAEEIKGIFSYMARMYNPKTGKYDEYGANPLNTALVGKTDTEKLRQTVSDYQAQTAAITESGKIMANAFGVTANAVDNLAKKTKGAKDTTSQYDAVAQRLQEWIERQGNASDSTASKLASLRIEYERLRKEAEKVGLSTTDLDTAYQGRFTEILNEKADEIAKGWNLKPIKTNFKIDTQSILRDLTEEMDAVNKAVDEAVESGELQKIQIGLTDKERDQVVNSAIQAAQQIFSTIEQMQQESIQRRLQDELDALNRETDSKKQALKAQQENGVISQKTYERKLNEIDKEAAAKQEELKKEAFNKQKKWNIASALINGALAITNLLANVPGSAINPATWVAIALATATTAVQVAAIASQKYARGGLLHGKSHAQGGIKGYVEGNPIELEGGETVINKRSSRLFARELSAINSYNGWGVSIPSAGAPKFKRDLRFARGGVLAGYDFSPAPLPMSAAQVTTALNEQRDKSLLQAIGAMVDAKIYNIRTYVLLDEIDDASNEKRTVVSRATL